MGPLIDGAALHRVSKLVENARDHGAAVLAGGDTDGPRYLPTLLENIPDTADLAHEEVFGPVTGLEAFDSVGQAIEMANRGGGGIHAGVFTRSLEMAETLATALDFGGVVIGGTSDRRSDALPFGGTGYAGLGREGVVYAADAMAELKTVLRVG
jgi:glyceraldehyde-3-phosphate dehydrogenase (NADP+)